MVSIFNQLPMVLSFYTLDTPYAEEVEHLRSSCQQFGIDCHIEGIPNQGSWAKNCAIKPFFIREKMQELQRPLIWVDADAVFLKKPSFEQFLSSDISVLWYGDDFSIVHRIRASTVFLNVTNGGREIIEAWCEETENIIQEAGETPLFLDQVSLYVALLRHPHISHMQMPLEYCKIFDLDAKNVNQEEVVIEQNQASRRFKSFFEENAGKVESS